MIETDRRTARVLIRVSSASDAQATMSVAVDLAGALGSDIAGLFVEEEAWFAAGALPFPTMLGFSGRPIEMTTARLAATMQREADACRRLFAHAAERARLRWSFHAERGEWQKLLDASLGPDDIVVLRRDALSGPAGGLFAMAFRLAPERGGVLLLPSRPHASGREIVILNGGTGRRSRLAATARRLAEWLSLAAIEIDLAAAPDPDAVRYRLNQAWLVIASLDNLGEPRSAESAVLGAHVRAPLLLLRTPDED